MALFRDLMIVFMKSPRSSPGCSWPSSGSIQPSTAPKAPPCRSTCESGRIFIERLAAHGLGYQVEVPRRDLELTEAEGRTPVRLVLDERQLVDQRLDRRLVTLEELDVDSIGPEFGGHLHLIDMPGS